MIYIFLVFCYYYSCALLLLLHLFTQSEHQFIIIRDLIQSVNSIQSLTNIHITSHTNTTNPTNQQITNHPLLQHKPFSNMTPSQPSPQPHPSPPHSPLPQDRQRSREKPHPHHHHQKLKAGQLHYDQYLQKQEEFHENQQVLRSFLRIEQGRQQSIDRFVKILYVYKGKYEYDPKLHDLMLEPKKYLNKLSLAQLQSMLVPIKRHLTWQQKLSDQKFVPYWSNLLHLIEYKIEKKQQKEKQLIQQTIDEGMEKYEIKQKVKNMLNKNEEDLMKLNRKIEIMLKNTSFGMESAYWRNIKMKIKGKLYEMELRRFFDEYKAKHLSEIQLLQNHQSQQQQAAEPISPILHPFQAVNYRLLINEQEDARQRLKLSQNIFRQEFEKYKEKLETNLSLPKNHNLLSKDFVTESTKTYDLITQEIMEFEKYKRMEEDEEEFDDWVPVETQGRFRDRKPQYINRVRISFDHTRYGQSGVIKQKHDQKQPPPKQVQGYKFNIFYPDLFDKEKTPQYYLEGLEDPNYMMIKFKAGPPYKDIGFKILRKEWDFTEKSGFEAIFTKGILQLYFNFKKPKYRI